MTAEQMATAWERGAEIIEQMDMDDVRKKSGIGMDLNEEEIEAIYTVCDLMREQADRVRADEVVIHVHSNLRNPKDL